MYTLSRHHFSDLARDALTDLWSRVDLHCRIQSLIEQSLPRAFRGHVQVACIEDDSLVLLTDSPLWASDLRYRNAHLLKSVNSRYQLKLLRCQIQVRPGAFIAQSAQTGARPGE